jgi:hypothetical protein
MKLRRSRIGCCVEYSVPGNALRTLPPVRTDRERLADDFVRFLKQQRAPERVPPQRERDMELTR